MFLASAMISEALPLITVGLWERTKSVAVFVRKLVAPTPTGSSTQTFPSSWALAAALCMDLIHGLERVPMLITSAEAKDTNSSTSSSATKLIFLDQYSLSTIIAGGRGWNRSEEGHGRWDRKGQEAGFPRWREPGEIGTNVQKYKLMENYDFETAMTYYTGD